MTVKELIKKLKQIPPDSDVWAEDKAFVYEVESVEEDVKDPLVILKIVPV